MNESVSSNPRCSHSFTMLGNNVWSAQSLMQPCPWCEIERLQEWERLFAAFVRQGLPIEKEPLWPNPKWSQDVAMVAHALAAKRAAVEGTDAVTAEQSVAEKAGFVRGARGCGAACCQEGRALIEHFESPENAKPDDPVCIRSVMAWGVCPHCNGDWRAKR